MALTGREDSVKRIFDDEFKNACNYYNKVEMNAPLNGLDRHFNADNLFSTFDKFFLIEYKSYHSSVKHENRKTSACDLCCGLSNNQEITTLHDECHFIMWGSHSSNTLTAEWDIYKNAVCNTDVLPNCNGANNINGVIKAKDCHELAVMSGGGRAGLDAKDFEKYLLWLLGDRNVGRKSSMNNGGEFKAAIYATSGDYCFSGLSFNSINDLYAWANGPKPQKKATWKP